MLKYYFLFIFLIIPLVAPAQSVVNFTSPRQQTTLLELYTSEGCSSCPPADRWLSKLKDHPQLWKRVIPIAFHVDYWNYLGWKDIYSKKEYSQRQRHYARFNNLSTIYTPGFLRNGQEWRGWYRHDSFRTELGEKVGSLKVTIENNTVSAIFRPEIPFDTNQLVLNVSQLGFNLATVIKGGENKGKILNHDFVSLQTSAFQSSAENGTYRWEFPLNPINNPPSNDNENSHSDRIGIAFWLTRTSDPTPIQATGGWL